MKGAAIIEDCGCKVMRDDHDNLELKYCSMHKNAHKMFWALKKTQDFINNLVLYGIAAFNPKHLTEVWSVVQRTVVSVETDIELNQQGENSEKTKTEAEQGS